MKHLFWIDLEMTGLDEKEDHIIEVAAQFTDLELNLVGEPFHQVVFQPPEALARMDDWCKKTHGESGLTEKIPNGQPLHKVEESLIEFCQPYLEKKERIILCGNSVGNDQRFIAHHMREFSKNMHYRVIDVSSYKEIFKSRWKIEFAKKNTHRALDDIIESIEELKMYLSYVKVP